MNLVPQRFIFRLGFGSQTSKLNPCSIPSHGRRKFSAITLSLATPKVGNIDSNVQTLFNNFCKIYTQPFNVFLVKQSGEDLLLVVGGGAAGIYGAIRAKTLAPNLKVVVIEKAKPLSKVNDTIFSKQRILILCLLMRKVLFFCFCRSKFLEGAAAMSLMGIVLTIR